MKQSILQQLSDLVTLLLAVVLTAGCSGGQEAASRRAIVTIDPLRYFVEQIAGEDWEVSSLLPAGMSPEDYTPSARQMAELEQSRCLFKIGRLGYENTLAENASANTDHLYVCNTSDSIDQTRFDPHTWTSPRNAIIICRNIARTLSQLDPDKAPAYNRRLARTERAIDSLHRQLLQLTVELPSRSFIIAHPALSCFAADYNLRQIAIEDNGKEPTPASIRRLIEEARRDKVGVIFVQQEFSDNSARVIARETGARIVRINPLDYNWSRQLLHIAQSLKNATQSAPDKNK